MGHKPTKGSYLRNFMMGQLGDYGLVAYRNNDNIVVFNRNKEAGQLIYPGEEVNVSMVVCELNFYKRVEFIYSQSEVTRVSNTKSKNTELL